MNRGNSIKTAIYALSCALLCACSSTTEFLYAPQGSWQERAETQSDQGITVTAAVPSASETKELFGQNLYRKGIQPVWLKIENSRDESISFLPVGLDPSYYSPNEAANISAKVEHGDSTDTIVDRKFFSEQLGTFIPAGATRSGFIFSKLDEGTKAFNVDIVGDELLVNFTYFIPVPGLNVDHYQVDWENLYPKDAFQDLSKEDLIEVLESFPCCVNNKDSTDTGDPLNLVIIGHPQAVYYAFIRAGWDETEAINRSSAWKTFKSFVGGGEYRYSPISSLYVFDRPQDVAFQKARDNIHERNHLRLWLAPGTYQGEYVWIGQISRDIGVRWTTKTITTHKIDPDVDETRASLLENLVYHQALRKFAYVGGVGEYSIDKPRGNLTGDPWFTDGYRLVLWVSSQPVTIDDLEYEVWRTPYRFKSNEDKE